MTIPLWMLLGFATWTLVLLIATVGVHRWVNIVSRKAAISSFRADRLEGPDWYQRGTRAHANCVENLPVFAAIVVVISAIGLEGPTVNWMCALVLISRIIQSCVHLFHVQTDAFVAVRFSFFSVQLMCFLTLIVLTVRHAA